ncbi:MAG: MerR family DNA-binding protein [Bdellovibrionales bacterium]|nr:MerR family DNA-binding protein [Bdellovibrionales bacterium]
MNMKESLTIGKLAGVSGVNVETVRFYERKGLLKQPKKQGAFRYYPDEYIARIRFIKRSQELGFTLKETKELLDLKIKNHAKCSDVLSKTEEKIAEINHKISDLKKMKKSLEGLANCCVDIHQPLSDCPILECFMDKREK